jgi:DNA-binding protein YbaB
MSVDGVTPEGEAFLDPDSARDYLRSWNARVERQGANARAMSERIGELRTTAKDSNDLTEVTIDSTGVLLELKFTDRIRRIEPDVVARAVMAALREARVKAADRAREIAVETMGPDSLSARTIGDRMRQLLEAPDATDDDGGNVDPGRTRG